MQAITELVVNTVIKGITSILIFIKNINLEGVPKVIEESIEVSAPKVKLNINSAAKRAEEFGLSFGGACITENDWKFMKSTVERYEIKTVLEFGAGLSTILFSDIVDKLISYESVEVWFKKSKEHVAILIKEIPAKANIIDLRLWDGIEIKEPLEQFDLAFVDGPAQTGSKKITRNTSTKIAFEHANYILVHDAGREFEMKWQLEHLQPTCFLIAKGGSRCLLWVKKDAFPSFTTHLTCLKRYNITLGMENKKIEGETEI